MTSLLWGAVRMMVLLDLKVSLFLLEKKSHGLPTTWYQKQGLRFVLLTPVLPAAPPLMMGLMETSTASMGELLEVGGMRMAHLAPAPATLASVVQTVLPALQAIVDHLLMIALLILV